MTDTDKLVRKNILELTPYSCARDEYKGSDGIFLDANENPFGPLNRYPDPYQSDLKRAVSLIKGIPEKKIFLGNGSDEIIDLCFRIFCTPGKDKALTFSPSYGMYSVSAAVNDVEMITVSLDENYNIDLKKVIPLLSGSSVKIVFICSPNNPTGNCMDRSAVETIITSFNGIAVIDEAYIDFSDNPSFKDSLERFPNLIVMHTFSKAFGLASVRVGIAFASESIISYFNKIKPPYNISTINQQTVLRRIAGKGYLKGQVRKIKSERKRMTAELTKLPLVKKIWPSDANFLLVQTADADAVYDYLSARKIIVRNRNSVAKNCIRITIGTRKENNNLLNALKDFRL